MIVREIVKKLCQTAKPENIAGMARFGIRPKTKVFGVNLPVLRCLAKDIGKNHFLAGELWATGIHEARILASMVDELKFVTSAQMDKWAGDFDSWDICDQVCLNLFFNHHLVFKKVFRWAKNKKEFVRRAGFALLATAAFKNKQAGDEEFLRCFPLIKKYAADERNFVKKAVNWALRQIGKRNPALRKQAIKLAEEIFLIDSKPARWVASGALRELRG